MDWGEMEEKQQRFFRRENKSLKFENGKGRGGRVGDKYVVIHTKRALKPFKSAVPPLLIHAVELHALYRLKKIHVS